MKKRNLTALLTAVITASAMVSCSFTAFAAEDTTEAATEAATEATSEASEEEASGQFVLEYPENMQELGFTEPVVLDSVPERVVSLSTAPVLALYEMGAEIVGVPSSSVVEWPEDLQSVSGLVSFNAMSADDFDYESVVALDPDIVFLSSYGAETAGPTLEELGIPCYYVYSGHGVSYDAIKEQTQVIVDAFSVDEESTAKGEELMARFDTLEADLTVAQEAFSGTTVMVLQSSGDSHYIQTADGTLGTMADMLGFVNVYENEESSMVELDMEQALDYDPDLLMCVGATTAEEHKEAMKTAFANNEEYWNAIPAVSEGNILYLPVEFCSTAGIYVVDNLYHLMDLVSDYYGVELEVSGSAYYD